ncbi:MAG TPA: tRNA preQ1(34) S-adenosylmethionine ribosyltransferase-isomerase QueA, partial [Vicinamibacteria bacterium]
MDLESSSAYDYVLPPGRIARYPSERRDESRLLVVPRDRDGAARDLRFRDLPSLLAEGDLIVLNESGVFPARLLGRKPTGAECEILLLRPIGGGAGPTLQGRSGSSSARWEAFVRPGGKLKPGRTVVVSDELRVVIEEGLPGGARVVRLDANGPVAEAIERFGRIPLPPYLERDDEPIDRERYQTVYAREAGSVAAPTAGLHFTPELLERVRSTGVGIARVTLHVGPGTFRPLDAASIREHEMHREDFEVPPETARAIADTRRRGGRVWAIGTTVVRTLESAAGLDGEVRPGRGSTDLFIAPGYRFRVVDGLVTNFHLPRSTLLVLVAAFAGHRRAMDAYRHAIDAGYRFYSYGDAM